MASIHERLLTTEEALLLAAIDGTSALDAFSETLQVLFEDIEQADGLSKETTELAYAVASRVAIYAETFHDLYLDNESISSGMMNEVEDILAHLSVADELSMSSIPSLACIQTDQSSNKTEKLAVAPLVLLTELQESGPKSDRRVEPTCRRSISPVPSLVSCSSSEESEDDELPSNHAPGQWHAHASLVGPVRSDPLTTDCQRARKRLRVDDENFIELLPRSPSPILRHKQPSLRQDTTPRVDPVPEACSDRGAETGVLAARPINPGTLHPQRKRRLSDADAGASPKRPRGSTPRCMHTVSDPFPKSASLEEQTYIIDDWFNACNFDVPTEVSLAPPDAALPLEIDVFDGWAGLGLGTASMDSERGVSIPLSMAANSLTGCISGASIPSNDQPEAGGPATSTATVYSRPPSVEAGLDTLVKPLDQRLDAHVQGCLPYATSPAFSLVQTAPCASQNVVAYYDELYPACAAADPSLLVADETGSTSPPPPFTDIIAFHTPGAQPPRYTLIDQFPESRPITPPPPYIHSSQPIARSKHQEVPAQEKTRHAVVRSIYRWNRPFQCQGVTSVVPSRSQW